MNRGRLVILGVVVAAIVGAIFVGRSMSSSTGNSELLITPRAVERRTLSDVLTVQGEVRREEILEVLSSIDGRVSALDVEEGDVIEAGQRVFAVDGRAAIAVDGEFPFYRTLQVGSEGPDVEQLERILVNLGHDVPEVDTLFTEETRTALAAWQAEQGYGSIASEAEETVSVSLVPNAAGYTLGRANSAAFTIVPSDPSRLRRPRSTDSRPQISVSYSTSETTEGKVLTVGFVSDKRLEDDLTIDYSISGTATSGVDFERPPSTVVMRDGSTFASFEISVFSDDVVEGDEDIVVTVLGSATGSYRPGKRYQVRYLVADATPSGSRLVDVFPATTEVDEGQSIVFTIRTTAASNLETPIEVVFGGTAAPESDFITPTSEQLTIPAGSMSVDVPIKIRDDGEAEPRETLTFTVVASTTDDVRTTYVVGTNSTATVEIRSGETPEITLSGGGSIPEGRAGSFVITADDPVPEDTSINYQIGGTATPGVDYQVLTGTVIMRAGTNRTSISVKAFDDDVVFQPTDMLVADWPVRVGGVAAEIGDQVVRGTPVLSLSESSFTIALTVGAAERAELEVGQKVTVDLTVGDQLLDGVISSLDESANLGPNGEEIFEGIVTVEGDFAGVDGASVTVDVTLAEVVDVLAVPVASVLRTADGDIVRVVNDQGTITRVPVTIGLIDREWAEIVAGLEGNELVIVDVETDGRTAQTP